MNSVSIPSRPLARASSASSAMSLLLARSLTVRPNVAAGPAGLLPVVVAIELVEVHLAQQIDREGADDDDQRVEDAGDAGVQQERDDREDQRGDRRSDVGHHARSTVGSRGRSPGSKRAS